MNFAVVISYDEIGLKTWNIRKKFVISLAGNIKVALKSWNMAGYKIRNEWDKLFIATDTYNEAARLSSITSRVFGVASAAPSLSVSVNGTSLPKLLNELVNYIQGFVFPGDRFLLNIRIKDSESTGLVKDKIVQELRSKIEERIPNSKGTTSGYEREVHVLFRNKDCYCYGYRHEGPGGFPLGSNGKAICLVSGGIDSPVASWMMMKRGMHPIFVHCKTHDRNAEIATTKIRNLVDNWCYTNNKVKYYTVRYDSVITAIQKSKIDNRYSCVFCRRLMLRIAEEIAKREKAQAIVTGESLGQVASQTSWNIASISEAVSTPVFRPLIGLNKREIVDLGRKTGCFSDEMVDANCCLYLPESPAIYSDVNEIINVENEIDVQKLLDEAISSSEVQKLSPM